MAIDVTAPRSRRSLITAALGGVAAAAAATLTGAQRVLADGSDDQAMLVGNQYADVRTTTSLQCSDHSHPGIILYLLAQGANEGLRAVTNTGVAVNGIGDGKGWGVMGQSTEGTAVHGVWGANVQFTENYPAAVLGEAALADGVSMLGNNYATSGIAQGVQGTSFSPAGYGTTGWSTAGGTGVVGASGPDFPSSRIPARTGVYGRAEHGRGGVFEGPVSQLRLVPAKGAHPASGQAGDLFMDHANKLWLCKGGTSWRQFA